MCEDSGAATVRVNLNRLCSSLRLLSDELLNITVDDLKQMKWTTRLRVFPALFGAHNRTLDIGEQLRTLINHHRQFQRQATASQAHAFRRQFTSVVLLGLSSTGWSFGSQSSDAAHSDQEIEEEAYTNDEAVERFIASRDVVLDGIAHAVFFISGNETRETMSKVHASRQDASQESRAPSSAFSPPDVEERERTTGLEASTVKTPPATPGSDVRSRRGLSSSRASARRPSTSTTTIAPASEPLSYATHISMLEHENRQLRRQLRTAIHSIRTRDQVESRIGNIMDTLCCTIRNIADIPAGSGETDNQQAKASKRASTPADSGGVRGVKAASTWKDLLLSVEHLHQAWVEANRTAAAAVAASMARDDERRQSTETDSLQRRKLTPSQLRAVQLVGSSASVSGISQADWGNVNESSLTEFQQSELSSSIMRLIECLQQQSREDEPNSNIELASQDVLLRLALMGKHSTGFQPAQNDDADTEPSFHHTAIADLEHSIVKGFQSLRRKMPLDIEEKLQRVRQQFDATVYGLRSSRSQLQSIASHSRDVSRMVAENHKLSSRFLNDAMLKVQAQVQRLQALDEHIHCAQQARIEWPGAHAPKMVRPFEMVSKGYLGAEMSSLSLFLREYSGEISQLHDLLSEVSTRLQTRDKSFSAKLETSIHQSSLLDLSN